MKTKKVYYIGVIKSTEGEPDVSLFGKDKVPLTFPSYTEAYHVLNFLKQRFQPEFSNFTVISGSVVE